MGHGPWAMAPWPHGADVRRSHIRCTAPDPTRVKGRVGPESFRPDGKPERLLLLFFSLCRCLRHRDNNTPGAGCGG